MTMILAEGLALPANPSPVDWRAVGKAATRFLINLAVAYAVLLAVHAYLGNWNADFLKGRDLWHFWFSRMVIPMIMLGFFASTARILPSAALLAALLLFVGTLSAIKREATGEPFQVSDLFLAGQSVHLTHYVTWDRWLLGASVVPATYVYVKGLRPRWWSVPLAIIFAGLLSTYRLEAVSKWIHDNSWRIGVENLTFSQAESERMNGLATHLYFSTAGLRLKTFTTPEVKSALDALSAPPPAAAAAATGPLPDVYVILGEAWWRDPSDKASPLDQLKDAGFAESWGVSPVYGGTTPNSEFEVLTAIPVHTFPDGIIPYQHYVQYITDSARALPRLLTEDGYATAAYHNFTRRFWLRDQIYPHLGFGRFVSMDQMTLTIQDNDWPTDKGLYEAALQTPATEKPQFHFLVTVETHGPYEPRPGDMKGHEGVTDYRTRLSDAASDLAAFKKALDQKGRPYVLVLFGDHLPGLRMHQMKTGMVDESDPRLHQVPILIAGSARKPADFAKAIAGRPLYCMTPTVMNWVGLPLKDAYLRHVSERCTESDRPRVVPADAVIQNQLFMQTPL